MLSDRGNAATHHFKLLASIYRNVKVHEKKNDKAANTFIKQLSVARIGVNLP